jgi:hypothetical protein
VYGLNREPTDPVLWRQPLVSASRDSSLQGPEGDHSHTDGQTLSIVCNNRVSCFLSMLSEMVVVEKRKGGMK